MPRQNIDLPHHGSRADLPDFRHSLHHKYHVSKGLCSELGAHKDPTCEHNRETGGEELAYRVALMAEELGEISACVTKGKPQQQLAEECADLFILLLGTAIAADFDLRQAFWAKLQQVQQRESRIINGRIRVSEFRD